MHARYGFDGQMDVCLSINQSEVEKEGGFDVKWAFTKLVLVITIFTLGSYFCIPFLCYLKSELYNFNPVEKEKLTIAMIIPATASKIP